MNFQLLNDYAHTSVRNVLKSMLKRVEVRYRSDVLQNARSFKVPTHQSIKYVCRSCQEQVSIATEPPQPIEKGIQHQGCALR
jgi:hypothetical protein